MKGSRESARMRLAMALLVWYSSLLIFLSTSLLRSQFGFFGLIRAEHTQV